MKCSRRSVTNLADLTIGLPGSLNVRVLCSMYRTSHINEESRLCKREEESRSWKKKKQHSIKQTTFLTMDYKRGEKASYSSTVLSCLSSDIKSENVYTQTHYPTWPAESSFLRLPVLPRPAGHYIDSLHPQERFSCNALAITNLLWYK